MDIHLELMALGHGVIAALDLLPLAESRDVLYQAAAPVAVIMAIAGVE